MSVLVAGKQKEDMKLESDGKLTVPLRSREKQERQNNHHTVARSNSNWAA
jgi:hypothetical protein